MPSQIKYIGVTETGKEGRFTGESTYRARITVNGKKYDLGSFSHRWQAAHAYDRALFLAGPYHVNKSGEWYENHRKDNCTLEADPSISFTFPAEANMIWHLKQTTGLLSDL